MIGIILAGDKLGRIARAERQRDEAVSQRLVAAMTPYTVNSRCCMSACQVSRIIARLDQRAFVKSLFRSKMARRAKAIAFLGHRHESRWKDGQDYPNRQSCSAPRP